MASIPKFRRVFLLSVLVFSPVLFSAVVTVDPDPYPDGVKVSDIFPGIQLSAVGSAAGLDGEVYAYASSLASTQPNVFGNSLNSKTKWNIAAGHALRIDFTNPADSVSIDAIADSTGDNVKIEAYNSSDQLIAIAMQYLLGQAQQVTITINRPAFDIAYVIAGGIDTTVELDHVVANVIPEPATLILLSLGGLTLLRRRK